MSPSALLLRVLLSLALVFSGSGSAVAATTMQLAHAAGGAHDGHGQIADSGQRAAGGSCHEAPDGVHAHATHVADTHDGDVHSGMVLEHDNGTPDCCQDGQCHCPCAHQLAATMSDPCLCDAIPVEDAGLRLLGSGYPPPPLPHLIRPPIG